MTGRRPLVLEPFRGLRFDATAGDLGTLVSPPYDVLDAGLVKQLEDANRHNVVRLILSRHFEPPYQAVRRRLEKWRRRGYVTADADPALYLYEYTADGTTVCGLVGLLALREEEERVVLPHEDVMAPLVADRALLMRTTETNLEPILLVHPGSPGLRGVYDAVRGRPAIAAFTAVDGTTHRLWGITDPAEQDAVAVEIAPQQALIADGHHRYAAYRTLQAELASTPGSPWHRGLAMLVPDDGAGLQVGPIHRVVRGLTLADVLDVAADRGDRVEPVDRTEVERLQREAADAAGPDAGRERSARFWLSDGGRWVRLETRRGGLPTEAVDTAVLHDRLFPAWGVTEEQVGYYHSLDQALRAAAAGASVVVAVRAPALADVTAAAAQGHRLPRKSTSFSPKPSMGVVLRDLRDD